MMKLSEKGALNRAVHSTLALGAACSPFASGVALAQDGDQDATKLDRVVVTGSRIRRVDTETASPVFTIDRAAIERSGVTTLGELIQELPTVSGAATNPQVNNGGGDGSTVISLRGLEEQRTLVLLNGRRLISNPNFDAVDVNSIPVNIIERVEVLKEGASAIYGSDAVAGVVNFITRKDISGSELSLDYGVSAEDDGERQSIGLTWGTTTASSNIIAGFNYNKQKEISAGDRDFSKFALYLYGGASIPLGSSRTPNGRIFLPASQYEDRYDCLDASATIGPTTEISVTRDGGDGSSLDDYRCYNGATDAYNFQPLNYILTPQERTSAFVIGNYDITDDVTGHIEYFHTVAKAGFNIAPLPFDPVQDDITISADNVYNPFGVDLGGKDTGNGNALYRLEALGNRRSQNETTTDQFNLAADGPLGTTTWNWDANVGYGRVSQFSNTKGYLFQPELQAALGPSYIDANGEAVCGTPGSPVLGCTPINLFNLSVNQDNLDTLNTLASNYGVDQVNVQKTAGFSVTGDVFNLSAGTVAAVVGVEYREERLTSEVDLLARALPPDFLNCRLSQETCTNATNGSYDVTEYYGEVFAPLVSDMPGVQQLNLILGTRFSDYSNFGSTTNSKVAMEWKPIGDLLVRASYAEVFRAPTVNDLFAPQTSNAPTYTDPCEGLTQADVDANANLALACENVARDGSYVQILSQTTGLISGNSKLEAEEGNVLTYGFVYSPAFLPEFSATIDFWKYDLEKIITELDVNTTLNQCVNTGNPTFCDLIERRANGEVKVIGQPVSNLGELAAEGMDIGLKYRMTMANAGSLRFSLDTSYIDKWDNVPDVTAPSVEHNAGKFSRQFGNFARVRGLGAIEWSMANMTALWNGRYVHSLTLPGADGATGADLAIPSILYHDLSFGYQIPGADIGLQVGINNVTDEKPSLFYINNVLNANTDVETYDTIGRYYTAKVTYNF